MPERITEDDFEPRDVLARCYVALSEIDHDLRRWGQHLDAAALVLWDFTTHRTREVL